MWWHHHIPLYPIAYTMYMYMYLLCMYTWWKGLGIFLQNWEKPAATQGVQVHVHTCTLCVHVHEHSLGSDWPSGLDVKQSPKAQDVFFSANTRPHQRCWGDQEWGYHMSCMCNTDGFISCVVKLQENTRDPWIALNGCSPMLMYMYMYTENSGTNILYVHVHVRMLYDMHIITIYI